jgi:membrane fusion protein (multidrug efflux system)
VALAEATAAKAALGIDSARRVLDERRSRLVARRATVQAAQADVAAREADGERAALDRARTQALLERRLIARQEFDYAEIAFKTAAAALEAARQRLDAARAEVAQAEAELASQEVAIAQAGRQREEAEAGLGDARSRRGEVTVRSAEVASAEAQLTEARAALAEAQLNLEYTTIPAPIDGRVTRRTVEVGQVVQPGQPLLAVVDVGNVWVVANYKETQLTHVRPGQRARISVDTHPGLVLRARVDSIQSGTGSRFTLLPPENASGNFVKVVQRIPVKLVLEPGQNGHALLVPGMSVVPVIELR